MIKNIIFYISIASFILISFLTLQLEPIIFSTGINGMLFIISETFFMIVQLYFLVKHKGIVKQSWIYNLFIIISVLYLSFIYYRLYTKGFSIYEINLDYCKVNMLFLAALFTANVIHILCVNNYVKKPKKV